MIYSNLIYFLVVILILTTNTAPDQPHLAASTAILSFLLKGGVYLWLLGRLFSPAKIRSAADYSSAERQGSILAIFLFSFDIYLLDCQYYLALPPLAGKLPVIISFFGLLLFTGYLSMMWATACSSYRLVFGRQQTAYTFIRNNVKTNLPIILPWLLLSLFADLLQQSSIPWLKEMLESAWGEPLVFFSFFLCLVIIFPLLITRIWGCTPLPPGPVRQRIEAFCQTQDVAYANIMLWPLLEGQALTAGVMGVIAKFRYLLVTPALLAALTPEEIEAVMAHEIGHVKRRHLQLYLFLFLGFGVVAQLITFPLLSLLTNSDIFYQMIHFANKKPGNALALASTVPMFIIMIIYFRYILGFFMRNFERQADLYALTTIKSSAPLIQVFEKIAWLSGNIRDLPSWHHFGIGQRIRFLEKSSKDPNLIKKHDRKVLLSLSLYVLFLVISAFALWHMPNNLLEGAPREKFAEAVIRQKIYEEPTNHVWHQLLGDLQYSRKKYNEADTAYSKALTLNHELPEVLNNLAWMLLTTEDPGIFDPQRAIILAKKAVILQPSAHILDTLATAFWENGLKEQAILAEKRAIEQNPSNLNYYVIQLNKFISASPPQSSNE